MSGGGAASRSIKETGQGDVSHRLTWFRWREARRGGGSEASVRMNDDRDVKRGGRGRDLDLTRLALLRPRLGSLVLGGMYVLRIYVVLLTFGLQLPDPC